jgi:predicted SAM-dependent methyltransferase
MLPATFSVLDNEPLTAADPDSLQGVVRRAMREGGPSLRMLNLGCGRRFHPDWVNVDIMPQGPSVVRADVSDGIPFADDHFDAVYHSHMIEHIRVQDVQRFLVECRRVLKPGGILRIATPDLERLCAAYLEKLRASAVADHQWLVIEMLDQTVREHSGGAMLEYLRQSPLPNESFVLERIGEEGRELLEAIRGHASASSPRTNHAVALRRRIKDALVRRWYGANALLAMEIGRFRLSGEVHQWLYDRLSLKRVLTAAGFSDAAVRAPGDSGIAGWTGYFLEITQAGEPIKPDSIFMEAHKPA